jgi:hypothetical protein
MPLGHYIVAETRCGWYLNNINICPLYKNKYEIATAYWTGQPVLATKRIDRRARIDKSRATISKMERPLTKNFGESFVLHWRQQLCRVLLRNVHPLTLTCLLWCVDFQAVAATVHSLVRSPVSASPSLWANPMLRPRARLSRLRPQAEGYGPRPV